MIHITELTWISATRICQRLSHVMDDQESNKCERKRIRICWLVNILPSSKTDTKAIIHEMDLIGCVAVDTLGASSAHVKDVDCGDEESKSPTEAKGSSHAVQEEDRDRSIKSSESPSLTEHQTCTDEAVFVQ